MPDLLVIKEVAGYLRVNPRAVARMIARGELIAFRLTPTSRPMIHSKDLRAYIARRRAIGHSGIQKPAVKP